LAFFAKPGSGTHVENAAIVDLSRDSFFENCAYTQANIRVLF